MPVDPSIEFADRLNFEPGLRLAAMRAGYVAGEVTDAAALLTTVDDTCPDEWHRNDVLDLPCPECGQELDPAWVWYDPPATSPEETR